jgi:hypothetical protein
VNGSNVLGWILLAVWGAWSGALSGTFVQFGWSGRWSPDLWTALFVVLAARIPPGDIAKLALCLGLARVAVSVDPPAVSLAGALALGALLRGARGAMQLDSPVIAGCFAFVAVVGGSAWSEFVHLETRALPVAGAADLALAWRGGLATAVCTALFGGVLARLPGTSKLVRRRTWAVGASHR